MLKLLDGIYSTVVVRDILEREKRRGRRQITDPMTLRKIILFLVDNIGNTVSATSIGNTLINEGLLEEWSRKKAPSPHTVQAYVEALLESYIFYEVKRFDVKGREYLRTQGKYYIVDTGLRNYLLGFRNRDTGHVFVLIILFCFDLVLISMKIIDEDFDEKLNAKELVLYRRRQDPHLDN